MGKEKLCGGDGVIEDDKVSTEAVAAAELCQHQMHFVHTRQRDRETQRKRGDVSNSMTLVYNVIDLSMRGFIMIC